MALILLLIAFFAGIANILTFLWTIFFGSQTLPQVWRNRRSGKPVKNNVATSGNFDPIIRIVNLFLTAFIVVLLILYFTTQSRIIPPPPTYTPTPSTISITTPMQLFPRDGSIFNNYPRITKLIWEDTSQQVTYSIEIQFKTQRVDNNLVPTSPEFFNDMVIVSKLISQTSEFYFEFVGKQEGRWRIWAVDSSGHESPKSPWWTFTYTV